jgi:hypothetical protein
MPTVFRTLCIVMLFRYAASASCYHPSTWAFNVYCKTFFPELVQKHVDSIGHTHGTPEDVAICAPEHSECVTGHFVTQFAGKWLILDGEAGTRWINLVRVPLSRTIYVGSDDRVCGKRGMCAGLVQLFHASRTTASHPYSPDLFVGPPQMFPKSKFLIYLVRPFVCSLFWGGPF